MTPKWLRAVASSLLGAVLGAGLVLVGIRLDAVVHPPPGDGMPGLWLLLPIVRWVPLGALLGALLGLGASLIRVARHG
jgi:hypothetical protein